MRMKSELAEVIKVNKENWTIDVKTVLEGKDLNDVQVAASYCSPANGAVMGAMPEVGSTCYVTQPPGKEAPYASNFVMPDSLSEGKKGGRPDINPGDVVLRTTAGNQIMVRRGDVIIISSGTGIAQRHYIGRRNTIRDVCGKYRMETAGGFVEWGPSVNIPLPDGTAPTAMRIGIKKVEGGIGPSIPDLVMQFGTSTEGFGVDPNPTSVVNISLTNFLYTYTLDLLGNALEKAVSKYIEAQSSITLKAPIVKLGGPQAVEGLVQGSFIDLFWGHTHSHTPGSSTTGTPNFPTYQALRSAITLLTRAV